MGYYWQQQWEHKSYLENSIRVENDPKLIVKVLFYAIRNVFLKDHAISHYDAFKFHSIMCLFSLVEPNSWSEPEFP